MNLLVVILIQASFYALLGMGYVLIYRSTRVLNLAHGDLMVFGAYLFFETLAASGGNLTLAILLAVTGAALLGAMVYLGVMRPLASYPVAVGVLATIALGLVLRTIVTLIWSAQTRYPAQYLGQFGRPVELLPGVNISGIDLLILGAAVLAMIGFPILLRLSTIGIEMRGVAENAVLAAQRGINIHRITAVSWAAATIMAANRGHFLFDQGASRAGHLVRRTRGLCTGPNRRHGQPQGCGDRRGYRRDGRSSRRDLYRTAGRARCAVLGLTGRAVDQAVGHLRLARRA